MRTTTKAIEWRDMPQTEVLGGELMRAGFRGDECIATFNWMKPTMERWVPHAHPFDQIVMVVDGHMMLEIDDQAFEMGPRTIARVPGNLPHTGWPLRHSPVLNIDLFAPARPDYLFLAAHQAEYPKVARGSAPPSQSYAQEPAAVPFAGEFLKDTTGILYAWEDLPRVDVLEGYMQRSAFRGAHDLLAFNWIQPGMPRAEPHAHSFDQLVLVVEGRLVVEVDGTETECGPGSIMHVPAGALHTGWPIGNESVLNIDIFAPARADFLPLTNYQKALAN